MREVANPRILLAGGVLPVALTVVAVVANAGTGGDKGTDEPVRAKLTLERAAQPEAGYDEAVVSVPNQRLNSLDTTGGATSVLLRCLDRDGRVTVHQRHKWPLVEEDGYPPHIHQPAAEKVLDSLRRCRLTGSGIDFSGSTAGALPPIRPVQ